MQRLSIIISTQKEVDASELSGQFKTFLTKENIFHEIIITNDFTEGFKKATYDLVCIIGADIQYPPETIPEMLKKIDEGAGVVVATRREKGFFNYGMQSGLMVFKREIIERINLSSSNRTIGQELITKAKNAGYTVIKYDVLFTKKGTGKVNIKPIKNLWEMWTNSLALKFRRPEVVPFHPTKEKVTGQGFNYKGKSFIHHSSLDANETAFHRLSGVQIFIFLILFLGFIFALSINWYLAVTVSVALITTLYFADLLFNLYIIIHGFYKPAEITITDKEIKSVKESGWPTYTILCPLYKEADVVSQFVTSMSRLDYPKNKLQVMLLLEEDDKETIEKISAYKLPTYFSIVIVPHSLPKTKPKACNYGLKKATGEFLVIYDAEDVPDPLQLKKAVLSFNRAGSKTVCIQAKLNFYNPHQNLLTRIFTAEYSLWFDLVLTGLQSIHAPIPLGGTSNHFKTKDLRMLKGWDSFNVTEDADLGMRLAKNGYTTAIVDSVTLEEANSSLPNWFNQRSRWIKGYMQTYLVHMRDVYKFVNGGISQLFTFQLIIGGKIMSMFVNPIMWIILIIYFTFRATAGRFIETFFPTPVFYMAVFSLVVGNFMYVYYYIVGCIKHGHDELVKYVFLVPFYWLAMSGAAWVAFYKLIVSPHHWAKTRHGLYSKNKTELVDTKLTANYL